SVTPIAPAGIFSAPGFHVGLIEFEILVSLWLLWGKYPLGSWITAIAAFTAFLGVSFYQGWIGVASCGCFGNLRVHPWQAFAIDLTAVLSLLCGRPNLKPSGNDFGRVLRMRAFLIAGAFAGVAAITGFLAASASYWFGSSEAALAYFRGERVSAKPN